MINTFNNVKNLKDLFNKKAFDKFFGRIVSAISALAIINASAYSGYISAQSQATIEEVVVTSRKKSESLQDVPLSVATLGEQNLEEFEVESPVPQQWQHSIDHDLLSLIAIAVAAYLSRNVEIMMGV